MHGLERHDSLGVLYNVIIRYLAYWVFSAVYGLEVMFNYFSQYNKFIAIVVATLLIVNMPSMPSRLIGGIISVITDIIPILLLSLIFNSSRNLLLILSLMLIQWVFFSSMITYLYLKL